MIATVRPPIGYHGAKTRIAREIVQLFPKHDGYVEPFCGSLSVLLAKPRARIEIVNDLDEHLVTFWRVVRDDVDALARVAALTPHSRAEHENAWPIPTNLPDLERARRVWVLLTQGRAGRIGRTGWRHQTDTRGRTGSVPADLTRSIDRIHAAAARLQGVTLEHLPAIDVITRYGKDPRTLLYVDPPYLAETRTSTSRRYTHEMSDLASHEALADALNSCAAHVVISGYPSPEYNRLYSGWDRHEIHTGIGTSLGWRTRTEVIWSNRYLSRQDSIDISHNQE